MTSNDVVDLVVQQPDELPVVNSKQLFTLEGTQPQGVKAAHRHAARNSAYSVELLYESLALQARVVFCTYMFVVVEMVPL